ncbi:MAG TPA: hypothetical protein VJV78_08795 [Polyangiales bacterium]|nr:hypothetical protein [Polyangiales bacterium]
MDDGHSWLPRAVFALSLLVFAVAQAEIWNSNLRISGDEAHVLMTVFSMVKDGDLNLTNNYERKDYLETGYPLLESQVPAVNNVIPPEKGIGFPALLAPFYAIGNVLGDRIAIVAFAALVLPLLYWLCASAGLSRLSAGLACLGLSVCLPWEVHANLILPEVVAAAIVMSIAAAFFQYEKTQRRGYALCIGLLTVSLPILYLKYTALAAASGVLLARSSRLRRDWLVYVGAPLLWLYADLWVDVYGWSIAIGTGGGPHDFSAGAVFENIGNSFLDRDHGLLTRAPIALLAVLGLFAGPTPGRKIREYLATAAVAYALLYGLTTLKPGGSAPGRYLVASMPAYLALAAFGLLRDGPRYRTRATVYGVFVALSLLFLVVAIQRDDFGLPDWYVQLFPKRY